LKNIDIIEWCIENKNSQGVIEFPKEIFDKLDLSQAYAVSKYFAGTTFFKLPYFEIEFYEWLKINDGTVWDDLWNIEGEEPYLVSIVHLPALLARDRGFIICDLVDNDNYYFSTLHLPDKEATYLADSIKQRFLNKEQLTAAQTLLMEITLAPIDIWHFAYKYNISVQRAKDSVKQLVDDGVLVHLTTAEYIAGLGIDN
jgi:hypothetical protein